MVDKIITVKSVFDWTIEHTPSHSMPLANPKHAQDLISISLLTITKLKTKPQLDAYIRVGVTVYVANKLVFQNNTYFVQSEFFAISCKQLPGKCHWLLLTQRINWRFVKCLHQINQPSGSFWRYYVYQEPTVRGLQRKARLADLSSPHDVFCYQGTPCKMPHAIVCFLEDELNVLSKWEL
ncbi:hypothetical protein FOBRF1_010524 [Fusarium oxysporum]